MRAEQRRRPCRRPHVPFPLMEHSAPAGAEFYVERLERARALPQADRSADVQAWLAAHDALEAAAALLPELQPGPALSEPLGGGAALAGALQFLAHTYCHPPAIPRHPAFDTIKIGPQLPPLVRIYRDEDGSNHLQPTSLLTSILATGRLPTGGADLALLARMLLVAACNMDTLALRALQAVQPALFTSASVTQLAEKLQQLQARLASGSSGSSDDDSASSSNSACSGVLPTVQQLQIVWCTLAVSVVGEACSENKPEDADAWEAAANALGMAAARRLLQLQPNNPRSTFVAHKVSKIQLFLHGPLPS